MPLQQDPFSNIVNVHWRSDNPAPFIVLRFRIYRRFDWSPTPAPLDPGPVTATITRTGLFYSPFFSWPYDTPAGSGWGIGDPSTAPFDVEPNDAANISNNFTGTLQDMLALGISEFGKDQQYYEFTESQFYLGSQPTVSPGGRLKPTGSVVSSEYGTLPQPLGLASFFGNVPDWTSPALDYELYTVTSPGDSPDSHAADTEGGATVDTKSLDFSGAKAIAGDWIYNALGAVIEPLERGMFQHNPPFSDNVVAFNAVYYVAFQLLFQIANPPPNYHPD